MRFEKQNLRRRNAEAFELLEDIEYSDTLSEDEALEYANHLRAFAEYMGVRSERRREYISDISGRTSAAGMKNAAEFYGSIREAAKTAEQDVDRSKDRYDLLMLEEITQLEIREFEYSLELELFGGEPPYELVGENHREWIEFDGEIEALDESR